MNYKELKPESILIDDDCSPVIEQPPLTQLITSKLENQPEKAREKGAALCKQLVFRGNLERIKEAPVVSVLSAGSGKLISFNEDINFHGV